MSRNVGTIDQYVRIVVGLALVAFAFQDGLFIQGWHWVGLAGFVLLVTAFFRSCPAYSLLAISTRERRMGRT
jgi:Inner membrane protein YgaP-like, transmembrane domain